MIYVMLADGFEEIEAIEPIDIMRRAGLDVKTVGVYKSEVTGAHGVTVTADIAMNEVNPAEMELLMLPGGAGHELLDASNEVHWLISDAVSRGIYIAAICAAPSIIGKLQYLSGRDAVCFPGYEKYLYGANIKSDKCVVDGKFITAKGAGAAAEFGFTIVELLSGRDKAEELRRTMQY